MTQQSDQPSSDRVDHALAVEIDVTQAPVTITYAGNDYLFPPSIDDCDGDVIDYLDDMKLSKVLRALMSKDDWARFKETRPTARDYGALFDAFARKIGLRSTGE